MTRKSTITTVTLIAILLIVASVTFAQRTDPVTAIRSEPTIVDENWSNLEQLTLRLGSGARTPVIAVDGRLFLAYAAYGINQDNTYLRQGVICSSGIGNVPITENGGVVRVEAAWDNHGKLHLVWADAYQLYYRSYQQLGGWSDAVIIDDSLWPERPADASMALDAGGNVHVFYMSGDERTAVLKHVTVANVGWVLDRETVNSVGCEPHAVIDSRGTIHLVYSTYGYPYRPERYTSRNIMTPGWQTPIQITSDPRDAGSPALTVTSDKLYIVWKVREQTNQWASYRIKACYKTTGSSTFSEPVSLGTTTPVMASHFVYRYTPVGVTTDQHGEIHVAWQDNDKIVVWHNNQTESIGLADLAYPCEPSIAFDGSTNLLHLVWGTKTSNEKQNGLVLHLFKHIP